MADNNIPLVDFGSPEKEHSIIKVIGVGGGGGNAVNHMYREGIHDVTFVLCNTDAQALNDSPVPVHLQLGKEGLGAGNKPERARVAAEESIDDIRKMLNDGTRMTFITAGMGFHAAGYNDASTKWPWFNQFLGCGTFLCNNWPPQPALLDLQQTFLMN